MIELRSMRRAARTRCSKGIVASACLFKRSSVSPLRSSARWRRYPRPRTASSRDRRGKAAKCRLGSQNFSAEVASRTPVAMTPSAVKVADGALRKAAINDGRLQDADVVRAMTGMLKGFGCRQVYESLSCRNPRAADDCLWEFVSRGVPAPVANSRAGCGGRVEEAASRRGRRAGRRDSDGIGVHDDRRHGNVQITSR